MKNKNLNLQEIKVQSFLISHVASAHKYDTANEACHTENCTEPCPAIKELGDDTYNEACHSEYCTEQCPVVR